MAMFASAAAILAPSRWEGLGLHLYEATALGIPIVTNDNPPMNEIVIDGRNGLLVPGIPDGTARSGIAAFRPDVAALTAAIERLRDPGLRARLRAGARERRAELSWENTRADLDALVDRLAPSAETGVSEHVLQREQVLAAPLDETFEFFSRAENLEAITPPWLRFRITSPTPIEMRVGEQIRYRLRLHGVPVSWLTRIEDWEPPHGFVDAQLRGPYALWHHTHTFEQLDAGPYADDRHRPLRAPLRPARRDRRAAASSSATSSGSSTTAAIRSPG